MGAGTRRDRQRRRGPIRPRQCEPRHLQERHLHHRSVQPRPRPSGLPYRTAAARTDRPDRGGQVPAEEHGVRWGARRARGHGFLFPRANVRNDARISLHRAEIDHQGLARILSHPLGPLELPRDRPLRLRPPPCFCGYDQKALFVVRGTRQQRALRRRARDDAIVHTG